MRAKPHVYRDSKGRWLVAGVYIAGKRERKYFETRAEADLYLARIKAQITREGDAGWAIGAVARVQAANAIEILKPHGASLVDAAKFYAKHLEATKRSITFDELSTKYRVARKGDGRSARHLGDLKSRLNRFAKKFGDRLVAEITVTDVDDWLRELGLAPQSRANFRKVLHAAFEFAEVHGYSQSNPVAKTSKVKINRPPPAVLTAQQMKTLLAKAKREIVPYIAIAGFAGLRTSEVEGLDWACVDLARKRIEVKATHKTGHRWVDLQPNLIQWLAEFKLDSGRVAPRKAIRLRQDAAVAAEIKWESNCLRHSFGSAHAVHFQNPVLTSSQMGNTPRVLIEHYKKLITPEEAAEWFAITPDHDRKVVPIRSAAG